jgi:hypothetical protein
VQSDGIAVGQRNLVQARVAFESMREITADNRLQMAAANERVWAEEWKIERHRGQRSEVGGRRSGDGGRRTENFKFQIADFKLQIAEGSI